MRLNERKAEHRKKRHPAENKGDPLGNATMAAYRMTKSVFNSATGFLFRDAVPDDTHPRDTLPSPPTVQHKAMEEISESATQSEFWNKFWQVGEMAASAVQGLVDATHWHIGPAVVGASGTAPGTCSVEEGCAPTSPTIANLVKDAEDLGYGVKVHLPFGRPMDGPLDGFVAFVADVEHSNPKLQKNIETMLSNNFRHGTLFKKGDRMLVEIVSTLCTGDEWHTPNPFDAACESIEDPEIKKAINEKFETTAAAANRFLIERGHAARDRPLVAIGDAQQLIDDVMEQGEPSQATMEFDRAEKDLRAFMDGTEERREAYFLQKIQKAAGPGHLTCATVGAKHFRNMVNALAEFCKEKNLGLILIETVK